MTNTMTYDKKAEDKEMKSAIEVPSSLWMRCRQIVVEHGSTRKAADAIGVDHAYLHRLANGECDNPSDEVLAKLGLRKIVDIRYESVDAHGSFYDAYAGAREDMLVWKKRALLAEGQLKAEIDLRNATPTRMVVEGRKLTRHEIDRCASYAIETDILPRESWEDAGLYDFAHALNGGIGVVDDLAMWIRRLARSLEKSNPMNALPRLAMDYLKRHGLEGGPLRAEPAATASRTVGEQECVCRLRGTGFLHCGKLYRAHPNIIGGGGHCMNHVKQPAGLEQCGHSRACHALGNTAGDGKEDGR